MVKKVSKDNLFKFVESTVMKPLDSMEDSAKEFPDLKKTSVLAGIVALAMMVFNLFATMLSSMFVRSCDFWTGTCKTKFVLSELKNLDYLGLIFKNFLAYALIIFGLAAIYYIGSLILKKTLKYYKSLVIATLAIIPFAILNILVAPILGIVYGPLETFVSMFGTIYSISILFLAMKEEMKLQDSNKAVLYNAVVLTVSYIIVYYIVIQNILG